MAMTTRYQNDNNVLGNDEEEEEKNSKHEMNCWYGDENGSGGGIDDVMT